tara:strand:- start:875 stop:1186 length:312 start_codon:yes stop_codon:yes gene_type:complete
MASNEIHVNDIGTTFQLTFKDDGSVVDISAASTVTIILQGSDDQSLSKTGVLVGDGTDGKAKYITVSGDLDMPGTWKLQGKLVFASTTYYSDVHTFMVHKNLV